MEFGKLQEEVVANAERYGKKYGIIIDTEFALMKLFEEVGELTQAILIQRKQSRPEKHLPEEEAKAEVAKELADVIGMVMVYADRADIDLKAALEQKWIKRNR